MRLGGVGPCAARSAARAGLETGVPSRGRRAGLAAGAFVLLLAVPLGGAGETAGEFSGFRGRRWRNCRMGLAAVRRAAMIESRVDRQKHWKRLRMTVALSARARGAASYRLGGDALRRGRWTEAEERLTAPELADIELTADALHLLGRSLPGVRRRDGIALLRRVVDEFPEYGDRDRLRFDLGRRLARAGEREEALIHLDAAAAEGGFTLRGEALVAKAGALERLGAAGGGRPHPRGPLLRHADPCGVASRGAAALDAVQAAGCQEPLRRREYPPGDAAGGRGSRGPGTTGRRTRTTGRSRDGSLRRRIPSWCGCASGWRSTTGGG